METTTITRTVGGAIGAALFAIGLLALAPVTGAAQDQSQAQAQTQDGRRGPGAGGRGGRFGGPGAATSVWWPDRLPMRSATR